MADVLNSDEITTALAGLPGWAHEGGELVRQAELADFPAVIQAVDRVAVIAERANHHPDIDIRWRKLIFHLSTHSAGGITAKDLTLANEINAILGNA